jgi:hypothetical protein
LASLKLLLRRSRQRNIFFVGLVFICFGVVFGFSAHLYSSAILLSVGSSIIAAIVIWFMNPANEEAYEEFLSLGITKAYPSRSKVEPEKWVKWLRSARRRCVLLGTSHSKWCTDADFRSALEERLRNNVDVMIFFLDPNSSAAGVRAREEDEGRDTIREIKTAIRILWKFRADLAPDLQRRLKLYAYQATPSMGVTWIDDSLMVVSHILAGSMNVTSPCLLLEPGRYDSEHQNLYGTYARNVKSIEDKFSTEIIEANVHEYLPQE